MRKKIGSTRMNGVARREKRTDTMPNLNTSPAPVIDKVEPVAKVEPIVTKSEPEPEPQPVVDDEPIDMAYSTSDELRDIEKIKSKRNKKKRGNKNEQ